MEEAGLLDAVITQNIDRLHARAGSRELIEVHGSIASASCLVCGVRYELGAVRARHEGDPQGVPRCDCGAAMKPDVVLFGELLPGAEIERAQRLALGADLMLCIGSSLEVFPVAQLPELTLDSGGKLAILTKGPTPFDRHATVRMRGDVVEDLGGRSAGAECLDVGDRARPQRGFDSLHRELHGLSLIGRQRALERRLRRNRDRVAAAAQLGEPIR